VRKKLKIRRSGGHFGLALRHSALSSADEEAPNGARDYREIDAVAVVVVVAGCSSSP
jgi:hypothetical protein